MGNKHIQELSQHYLPRCCFVPGGGEGFGVFQDFCWVGGLVGRFFLISFLSTFLDDDFLPVEKMCSFWVIERYFDRKTPKLDEAEETCHFFPSPKPLPFIPFNLCGSMGLFLSGRKLAKSIDCYC